MTIEHLGNRNLLNQPQTAFLASNAIPSDMVLRCYDWAQQTSRKGECIISGFSSHLEEHVLRFLIRGTCPIILVLARQMYKRIPPELQPLLENGRLLIVSTNNSPRQSRATAQFRNRYICEQADRIVFVGVNEQSSLYPLSIEYQAKRQEL